MSKKIGHNYERDPYPWDVANKRKGAEEWSCCDMRLPATFYICPICEKERDMTTDCMLPEVSEAA